MSEKINKTLDKKIRKALIKKATGYDYVEEIKEMGLKDDEFVLSKQKTATKHIPPDVSALKLLLLLEGENDIKNISDMSDEELESEKKKILEELKNQEN